MPSFLVPCACTFHMRGALAKNNDKPISFKLLSPFHATEKDNHTVARITFFFSAVTLVCIYFWSILFASRLSIPLSIAPFPFTGCINAISVYMPHYPSYQFLLSGLIMHLRKIHVTSLKIHFRLRYFFIPTLNITYIY